jgi:hypothetical protein
VPYSLLSSLGDPGRGVLFISGLVEDGGDPLGVCMDDMCGDSATCVVEAEFISTIKSPAPRGDGDNPGDRNEPVELKDKGLGSAEMLAEVDGERLADMMYP